MPAWRRNQGRQAVDQFEGCQHQADAAARPRLDALIDQVFGVYFTQSFQGKGRPGAVAQQALQAWPVVPLDAHAGVEGETSAMLPLAHGLGVFPFEQIAPAQRPQQTGADPDLDFRQRFGAEGARFVKLRAAGRIGLEHALDHDAVKMQVGIEQGAKAVDEGDGADAGVRTGTRTALADALLHRREEELQGQGLDGWIALQGVAQAFRHRQYPLPHRQTREDVVGQMAGGFDHAPGVTGGTESATLARIRDEKIVAALGAAGAGKAVGEDAAFEVAAEFPFDMGRRRSALPGIAGAFEPGRQVSLHGAVEQGATRERRTASSLRSALSSLGEAALDLARLLLRLE